MTPKNDIAPTCEYNIHRKSSQLTILTYLTQILLYDNLVCVINGQHTKRELDIMHMMLGIYTVTLSVVDLP